MLKIPNSEGKDCLVICPNFSLRKFSTNDFSGPYAFCLIKNHTSAFLILIFFKTFRSRDAFKLFKKEDEAN